MTFKVISHENAVNELCDNLENLEHSHECTYCGDEYECCEYDAESIYEALDNCDDDALASMLDDGCVYEYVDLSDHCAGGVDDNGDTVCSDCSNSGMYEEVVRLRDQLAKLGSSSNLTITKSDASLLADLIPLATPVHMEIKDVLRHAAGTYGNVPHFTSDLNAARQRGFEKHGANLAEEGQGPKQEGE